jgi:hypothetical protein
MQFALPIYELPEAFAARKNDGTDSYTGAWRAYHKALVESGSYLAGDPLEGLRLEPRCGLRKESGAYRMAPSRTPRSNSGDS